MRTAVEQPMSVRLSGDQLLERLRGDVDSRPPVDPGMAPGLRDWLEDGLSEAVARLEPDQGPVKVTKDAVNQVLVCEAHLVAERAPRAPTVELALGSMVDALFRQWVTTGCIVEPWEDAVEALRVSGDNISTVSFVEALDPDARLALAEQVAAHAASIMRSWPPLAASWLPRTQQRLRVPLAGGRVELAGVLDLALGAPSAGHASVCIVEVKSGRRRIEHRGDIALYTLLETLRSGAPPFRVATFYTATGELDAEAVGRDLLLSALHRVLDATSRLCNLAAGAEPSRTPNPLCAWCAGLADCGPGRRSLRVAR